GTCQSAALESKTYASNPEKAAKMVTEVATTGKYHTADGTEVKVPQSCIKPDAESAAHGEGSGNGNERSQASQIFQGTAINIKYAEQNAQWNKDHPNGPKQDLRYEEFNPDPRSKNPATGDHVVDYSKNPPKEVAKGVGNITALDMERTNYEITGNHEKGLIIQNDKYADAGKGEGTTEVKTKEDLQKALEAANGPPSKFPLLMRVHTGNEPFNS